MATDSSRSFRLYVTHVDGEAHFLKISGQRDPQSSLMVESLFVTARENLENGLGTVPPAALHEGVICAAKYKDGTYYRAKIINTSSIATGLVGVHFIDFGNKDIISISTIRFLDRYDPLFLQLPGQASDYYLSRIMHPSGSWEEPILLKLQSLLCYSEYNAVIDAQTVPIISMQFKDNDLSTYLISNRFGVLIPLAKQEMLIHQLLNENGQVTEWQPSYMNDSPSYMENIPFLNNQNFPSNPASAMRLQQHMPFNTAIPPPSAISQRLLVNNKTTRNTVNLRTPARQPQNSEGSPATPTIIQPSLFLNKPSSPKKSITYKSRLLEVNSQHKVFVSYAEEGPELFAVQLVTDAKKFQEMMDDINRRPHSSLKEPPMIGTVCLGRMSGDRIICRAIVMNLSGSQCKLFFVDFGDTEMVSYYDIFDIPEEFVKPNVFAMRFCLSGVKNLEKDLYLNETFKQLVNGKVLTLRVVTPEGPPLIQYGELYLDNLNVLELLMANVKDKLQFKWMDRLPLGSKHSVLVSYVDSCIKFFIQLSDMIDELNAVMEAVKTHCENTVSPGKLSSGAACCARFPDDGNWYRAMVKSIKGNKVLVSYVDYGNEQEVDVSDLRTITPELINLPAQALKCALKSFEDKPVETKTSNQLEMLALEKTLVAHIVGLLSNNIMLVSLIDDTVIPPMDVAKRMNQLSQPRSSNETKVTTPVRKDAPDTFSSSEGSLPEDRKKSFRREKSFKDDRRPPRENNDEFQSRGSSFRGRDNQFDRLGPGRHSDKHSGRNDRSDRRGGPKPRESNSAIPAAAEEQWEESSTQSNTSPPNKDNKEFNRDRKKPRDQQPAKSGSKPAWRNKETSGAGKRLKQATEDASNDAQKAQSKGNSVQDRLRRDNKQDDWEKEKSDFSGRSTRDNRSERRDFRGERPERREKWGEKKDSYQKRDFRDNRGERNDRSRSNFTPRDRADRSFGSDGDKKSDKSHRSQDSGHAPLYKPKSKFNQVQYKELPNPVPLEIQYTEPTIEIGSQHEVVLSWLISPESFYVQISAHQAKFLELMNVKLLELYKGVKSYTGPVAVGSSVLARYPVDRALYRATVVAVQPFSKFIVRYVDFGNKELVDAKDLWQLDSAMLEVPQMAVHCSLLGVAPKDGQWKADPNIDNCFNGSCQCVFQDCVDGVYKVSLYNNGVSVADKLVEKDLAVMSEHQSSVTLKDEAIDLTIIIGQQIPCRVTHVESFDKFYIQLDLDKAALVENAIANFDKSLLTSLTSSSLAEGVHCTVEYEDQIYRAIISEIIDDNNIKTVLPDYGKTISTSLENIMILPTELSVHYYQSLECCLNNYTTEAKQLMSHEELLEQLTGNKFIVYINDVEDVRLVITLYDIKTGKKIKIFEPDEGAYDEVVPLCARVVLNYNFGMAYISHCENLNEIYLQKSSDEEKIAALLNELYLFYGEGTPETLESFDLDRLCVANSKDGNWYRATIISAEESQVTVQYNDYGNTETVAKECLKKLHPKFHEPYSMALVIGLGLVALQEDTVTKLLEWTNEKEVQVTLAFGSDGWLASLHLDGEDLSIKLVNEKLATPQIAASEEHKIEEEHVEEQISVPTECTQVYISHIDTPGHFWLQMADKVDKIEEIQAELQRKVDTYSDIVNLESVTLCVAKYSADDQWYRAEILDSDADIITVRFIDYGNTDVLDNQPGVLKAMPDNLTEIEKYAIKSSINAVPTGTGQWSEQSSDYFTQLVGDLSIPVNVIIVLKDITTYVEIFVNGQNLTDKLVSEGYAIRSEQTECGDLPSCFASHVNSPSEFWIQLESATSELQAMENAMIDAENFPGLSEKEEGVICAAKYPEDGAWYRAQIIVDGSEGTEVLFMDYGNASIATELRSLPEELKDKPALSRKCALQKPRDIKSWSRKSEVKFNELAAEGATIFNVQFIASGDISIVELYLENKSVTDELVELCEERPVSERPNPVGQDLHNTAKICHINSLEEFYVHLDNSVSDLDKITEEMSTAVDFETVTELKVGSICAAFWIEDEQWYRAKILELCDVGCLVQLIDYGNKSQCEEFRQLPQHLAERDPIAKCCCLAGLSQNKVRNKNAKNKLQELSLSSSFQVEYLDSTKHPLLVRLLLNGIDVSTIITTDLDNKNNNDQIEISFENNINDTHGSIKESNINVELTIEGNKLLTHDKNNAMDQTKTESISEFIDVKNKVIVNTIEGNISAEKVTEAMDVTENSNIPAVSKDINKISLEQVTETKQNDVIDEIHFKNDSNADLESSKSDLNESTDSTNTVYNKSFEDALDQSFQEEPIEEKSSEKFTEDKTNEIDAVENGDVIDIETEIKAP